jgi:hypothetical protein
MYYGMTGQLHNTETLQNTTDSESKLNISDQCRDGYHIIPNKQWWIECEYRMQFQI